MVQPAPINPLFQTALDVMSAATKHAEEARMAVRAPGLDHPITNAEYATVNSNLALAGSLQALTLAFVALGSELLAEVNKEQN